MLRLIGLAACLVLAVPAASSANTYAENQRIRSVMPLARVMWGGYPCRGQERIIVLQSSKGFVSEDGWGATGGADPETCRIWLHKATVKKGYRAFLCNVLTHEVGHLALIGTEADHRNPANHGIMVGGNHPLCDLA